jgi:hypothetical protein
MQARRDREIEKRTAIRIDIVSGLAYNTTASSRIGRFWFREQQEAFEMEALRETENQAERARKPSWERK